MKRFDSKDITPFPIYADIIKGIDLITKIDFPSKYFVLFLVADFREIDREKLTGYAKSLIDKGLRYICVWGPNSNLAHDDFDLGNIEWEDENDKELHVVSTSHEDESLDEALWFSSFVAAVDDEFWDECSTIVIVVKNGEWYKTVEECLSDYQEFNDRIVNDDGE